MNEALTKEAGALAVRARGLEVVDQASAARAAELILAGKEMVKRIKDFFAPLKRAQEEAKQKLISAERSELIKVEPVVSNLSGRLAAWRVAEEVKRKEAEERQRRVEEERRRLEEEAIRKSQEAERRAEEEKRTAEAEARRRELEAKNEEEARRIQEEAARKQAEADRRAKEEQDRILEEAATQELNIAPAPAVVPGPVRLNGLAARTYYRAVVVDLRALAEAVAGGQISQDALTPNMPYLNRLATAQRGLGQVPGVKFEKETRLMKTK